MTASWIPFVAVALGLMFGVGLFARVTAALARRRAPRALALVREALARRLPDEARRLLPSAFFMPISGRYSPGEAAVALGVLTAFEETLGTYRLHGATITQDLRDALERCVRQGKPVPYRLIGPFMSLLWAIAPTHAPLAKIVRQATERAAHEEGEIWEDEEELRIAEVLPRELAPAGFTEPAARPRVARASRG